MDLWVKNLLRKKLDLEKFQRPQITIQQAIQILEQSQKNEDLIIVGSQKNKIIALIRPTSPWVAELDIVADCKGMMKLYKELRKMENWFWKKYPNVHRLEMITTNEKVVSLALRAGWKEEGYKKESYVDYNTMNYKGEYMFALLNPSH
tara:strand:+ start:180 stop:623 length:444 start_codon:yes stop_codon:yes gene_type:complete